MTAQVFFSRRLQPAKCSYSLKTSSVNLCALCGSCFSRIEHKKLLRQSSQNLIQRRAIELIVAAIDVSHESATVAATRYQQCRRTRDINCVCTERMMQPVLLRHTAILIEQKNTLNRMLLKESPRLPNPITPLRRDKRQLRSCLFNLRHPRLELSHALHAIRSPGAAQKLKNQLALGKQSIESKHPLAVGGSHRKPRSNRTNLKSLCAVLHVESTLSEAEIRNNNDRGTGYKSRPL